MSMQKVKSILVGDKDAQTADAGRPVTIQLDKEVDVSRGCVLAKDTKLPVSKKFTATILWMDDEELTVGKRLSRKTRDTYGFRVS